MRTSTLLLTVGMLSISRTAAQPNTWVNTGAGSPARHEALGFAMDGKVYTCLGIAQDGAVLSDLWQYDPATQAWSAKAAFPGGPRTGAACFTVGSKAYIATGVAAGDTLSDLWEYDPVSDAWTSRASLPGSPRTRAFAFSIGVLGYVCTGIGSPLPEDQSGYISFPMLGDLWAYDPATDAWTQRTDLFTTYTTYGEPDPVWTGFVVDGGGYLIKGGEVWAYDPIQDLWAAKATLDPNAFGLYIPDARMIGFALGGHGYLTNMGWAGDEVYQSHPNLVLRYHPVSDTWRLQAFFSGLTRDNVALATSGPVAYIMGGSHLYPWGDPEDPEPTENDRVDLSEMWSYDVRDCQGIVDGPMVPGDPCDDGSPGTFHDAYDLLCTCTGSAQDIQPFHPDQIDETFTAGTGFDGEVLALCLQPDGKVIATGSFTQYDGTARSGIARLNLDGSLDAGFYGAVGGRALALQPDGRILVGGNGITRLMQDGSLDGSFDTYLSGIGLQPIHALAVRPDGSILAGGYYTTMDDQGNENSIGLMQLMPDGSRDPGFVPEVVMPTARILALLLRPNGNLLVGMDNNDGGGGNFAFNVAELQSNGAFSPTFHVGFSAYDPVRALAVRPNDDVAVGGDFNIWDDDHHLNNGIPRRHLAVVDATGLLQGPFDPGVSTDGPVRALACGPQGELIAGGDFTHYRHAAHGGIVQLNDYGYADPSFASGSGFNAAVNTMLMLPDGRLIVGGAFTSYNGATCGHITRLRTPGAICSPSQLTSSADPVISCGAVNLKLNGTSTIAAAEVPGANKYQFRFTNIAGQPAYSRNIAWPTRSFMLTKWLTNPLKAGRSYNVVVRASFDNGATWCDDGPSCMVKVSWTPLVPGIEARDMEVAGSDFPELLLYPNPTNGENLCLSLHGIEIELATATLDITDLFAKRVMSGTFPITDGELDTRLFLNDDLSNGVYIAQIKAGDELLFGRFTLAR